MMLAVEFLLVGALGSAIGLLLTRSLVAGIAIGAAVAILVDLIAWAFAVRATIALTKAVEVTPEQAPVLHNVIEGLCIATGLPKPKVYIVDDPAPNAFAFGRSPERSGVAVTSGLLNLMSRRELEGVLAHELSHVRNRDVQVTTLAVTTVGLLVDGLECHALDFTKINNKDAVLFPKAIRSPTGEDAFAMIHRPLFPGTDAHETVHDSKPRMVDVSRESMWISYTPCQAADRSQRRLCDFRSHHRLVYPVAPWEHLKIGCGTPPVLTKHGWLVFYHGVCESNESTLHARRLRYSAGVLLLSEEHPRFIRYRSTSPVLEPEVPEERAGTAANVVFPTGVDQRTDLEQPNRIDVYYGMADSRIGAARTDIPRNCRRKRGQFSARLEHAFDLKVMRRASASS